MFKLVKTAKPEEADVIGHLDGAIRSIGRQSQISPSGIEHELRETVLEPSGKKPEGDLPQVYMDVQRFCDGVDHNTNQVGALRALGTIRDSYGN